MPERYVSIPQEVDAVHWNGDAARWGDLREWLGEKAAIGWMDVEQGGKPSLQIRAGVNGAQGWVDVPVGHWVVSQPGDVSDIWPCEADYFDSKYRPA